jgi:hypothetical protein
MSPSPMTCANASTTGKPSSYVAAYSPRVPHRSAPLLVTKPAVLQTARKQAVTCNGMSITGEQPKLLAAQPEHFVLAEAGDGPNHVVRVVENLSRYISDFYITFTGEDQAVAELAPDYPIRMVGTVARRRHHHRPRAAPIP